MKTVERKGERKRRRRGGEKKLLMKTPILYSVFLKKNEEPILLELVHNRKIIM